MTHQDVLAAIRAGFRDEPRLGAEFEPETLTLAADGTLTLAGDVQSIAAKKLALEIAAAPPEVVSVVDRLRVATARDVKDRTITDHLAEFFGEEPAFQGFLIRVAAPGPAAGAPGFVEIGAAPENPRGRIDIEVHEGVVILNGAVPSLVSQRLAGAMAWWVPGVRDVVNGLEPAPPEEDGAIRIEEAVRIVLDRNPWVDDTQIRIGVRGRVVRLTGLARTAAERDMAESDAWSILGVDRVINEIAVTDG